MLRRPVIPDDCQHNAHMYYILLSPDIDRQVVIEKFKLQDISAIFHYVPLHSSPAGMNYGRAIGDMSETNDLASRLLRLPLWIGLSHQEQDSIISLIREFNE